MLVEVDVFCKVDEVDWENGEEKMGVGRHCHVEE